MLITPDMIAKDLGVTGRKLRGWLRSLPRFKSPPRERYTRYLFEPSDPIIAQAKQHFGVSVKAGKGTNA